MNMYEIVKQEIIGYMPKEYFCHLQFVHIVACELQKEKGGDLEVIEIAAIAHDYGRVEGGDNATHAELGSQKIKTFLLNQNYSTAKAEHVARCTLMHNKTSGFNSIEEEVVANADQLSKLLYHEAFMLLVKKDTYHERALWGLKYLEKGFNNATFEDIKDRYRSLYEAKKRTFEQVIQEIPSAY